MSKENIKAGIAQIDGLIAKEKNIVVKQILKNAKAILVDQL